jgi:histidine triad (HIT) family protein
MEQKCFFCSIAEKKIPAEVVYEDEYSIAILDIAPRSTGMTLVIPKKHMKSFDEHSELSKKILGSALTVAKMIKETLKPKDIGMAILPSELHHFHIRLYPIYENEVPLIENQPQKVSETELYHIAEKIKSGSKEYIEEPKKEKKKVKKRTKQDMYWVKRAIQLT